jgi:hypothetical protein
MAVSENANPTAGKPAGSAKKVRWIAGTNVAMATLLAVALVAVLQWGGCNFSATADLTTSGINSLSEGTDRLLDSLETEVTLTSTYYEADPEPPDQEKYRKATADLIDLYRMATPGKIVARYINPVQDHQAVRDLFDQFQAIPKYDEQAKPYREFIQAFNEDLATQIADALSGTQQDLASLTGAWSEGNEAQVLAAVKTFLNERRQLLSRVQETVQEAAQQRVPDYAGAISNLRTLYRDVKQVPEALDSFSARMAQAMSGLNADVAAFVKEAGDRFRPLAATLDEKLKVADDLPTLELEREIRQYSAMSNCVFVSTNDDVRMITFNDIWAPQQGAGPASGEEVNLEFRGEEKISSAILQVTQEQKPAVIFVRHGGQPLFFGGFRPNQPPAPYARMKGHLESLNFTVHEWDLASSTTPPAIDPEPSKKVYVVLKPSPTPPPMMQQRQPPPTPFGDEQRQALLDALGEKGRALFIAGWQPGQFGPSPYEYGEYLKESWGIDLLDDVLLIQAYPDGPDFRLGRGFESMRRIVTSEDVVVDGLATRRASFPLVAPLELAESPPEGVACNKLIWCRPRDGLWGVKDIRQRIQEAQTTGKLSPSPADLTGPFVIAASAEKGDAKIVVVSSTLWAMDEIAFANEWLLTARGLAVVNANPSNVTLLANSLHWLTDNTQWMNLGRPIESHVLEIQDGPTLTFMHALISVIWPALALVCGGIVWIVRRR